MAQPVVTITLGGTDITADVGAPEGGVSLTFGRGANFDGTAEAPGTAIVTVRNAAGRYNPANSGSPIAAILKVGKELRVTAVYSATTYALFHGYLRRIVPIPGPSVSAFAELHCEDALWKYGRAAEVAVLASESRSLASYRGAILDAVGETAGRRSLSTIGAEASLPLNFADSVGALSELSAIGRATGTLHFIKPITGANFYQYTTVDRNTFQSQASAETWSDTDFSQPFAEDIGGYDYTDEGIVNYQRVRPRPLRAEAAQTIWSSAEPDAAFISELRRYVKMYTPNGRQLPRLIVGRLEVGASIILRDTDTLTLWIDHGRPVLDRDVDAVVITGLDSSGAPNVPILTLTPFPTASRLDVSISGGDGEMRILLLVITGRPATELELDASLVEDASSQTTYNGDYRGAEIESELIDSVPSAEGLGAWIVYRYKDPRAKPDVAMVNRFPSQLQREVGDRIALTSAMLSLSAVSFFIRSFVTTITDFGGTWRTVYQLEAAPAVVDIFTVDGTGAQGLGGAAILGY